MARFDATLAGIGRCPQVACREPHAASEDLAFVLGDTGIATGIDIDLSPASRAGVATSLSHGTP